MIYAVFSSGFLQDVFKDVSNVESIAKLELIVGHTNNAIDPVIWL